MGETDLPEQMFPLNCPYLTEILDDRFYFGKQSEAAAP